MTQERVCRNCHVRLSGRADGQQVQFFAVYPNGCLVCYRCLQLSGEHVCPVTHRDFRISPALSSGEITPTPPTWRTLGIVWSEMPDSSWTPSLELSGTGGISLKCYLLTSRQYTEPLCTRCSDCCQIVLHESRLSSLSIINSGFQTRGDTSLVWALKLSCIVQSPESALSMHQPDDETLCTSRPATSMELPCS